MSEPGSSERFYIALAVLALLAAIAWFTMEPGKYRALTMVFIGFFAARVLIGRLKAKRSEDVS